MSVYNNKANYHPLSNLNGHAPSGSYLLPGTEYYSVDGKAPRLQFEHNSKINDAKYRYSQHHRIDPIHSLIKLKEESSLTRYYPHNEAAELCRERYIFVPKSLPRQEPNELHHEGLEELKNVDLLFFLITNKILKSLIFLLFSYDFFKLARERSEYKLREISKLPDSISHALPQADLNEDAYRIYEAKYP
jgi:hypothetical protein